MIKRVINLACLVFLSFAISSTIFASNPDSNSTAIKIIDSKRECALRIDVQKEGRAIWLMLQSSEKLCFGNYTRVEFTLSDGFMFSVYGVNEDNCDGRLALGFGGIYRHEKNARELSRQLVKTMLIKDAQNEYIFYPNKQQSQEIRSSLDKMMSRSYKSL